MKKYIYTRHLGFVNDKTFIIYIPTLEKNEHLFNDLLLTLDANHTLTYLSDNVLPNNLINTERHFLSTKTGVRKFFDAIDDKLMEALHKEPLLEALSV